MRLPKKYLNCCSERGDLHCEFLSEQHLLIQCPTGVYLMASLTLLTKPPCILLMTLPLSTVLRSHLYLLGYRVLSSSSAYNTLSYFSSLSFSHICLNLDSLVYVSRMNFLSSTQVPLTNLGLINSFSVSKVGVLLTGE